MKKRISIVLLSLICALCLALGITACTAGGTEHTHSYGEPVWTWSSDYSLATATFTCTGCGNEQVKTATVESSTEGTTITYTATVVFSGTYTDTRTATVSGGDTEQSGTEHTHTYGEPVWTWSSDYSLVTATFTCTAGDDEQVKTATIASSTEGTTITYTATVVFNGTYTDTRTATISGGDTEQSGTEHTHTYGEPVWTWSSDYSLATAAFTCTAGDDEQVKTATIESTTDGSTITYTATVEFGETYTDTRTATISSGDDTHTHTYTSEETLAPTCTEYGILTYTCTYCGYHYNLAIKPNGHTAGETKQENVVAATCTAEGSYDEVVYCTVCDAEISREAVTIPTIAHTTITYTGNKVDATCAQAGSYEKIDYCTVCGQIVEMSTVTIEKLEHTEATPVVENLVASTCITEGSYDEVVYCSVCNEEISRVSKIVSVTGHKWDSGKVTTAATATTEGVKTYTCTVCGNTKTTTIATISGGSAVSPSEYAEKMASTLSSDYGLSTRTSVNASGWSVASGYYTYLAQTIKTSSYDYSQASSLSYTYGTEIGIAIGYNSAATGAFYASSGSSNVIADSITIPGNYTASTGGIKPVFSAIQSALGVSFVDHYTGLKTSANIDSGDTSSLIATNKWGTSVDVATTDLDVAVAEANNGNVLNLADYLDYMPNFKKYLEDNPVVYLSLLQSGMSTTDGSGAAIYIAPTFDGADDIERYCLIRQDWVVELLDNTLVYNGDTYAAACASTTSVSGGWMGTVGSYSIESSTEDGSGSTFIIIKNYDAALAAAKDVTTELGAAYYAIANTTYSGTSGNIVDIMNAAIAANNGATGKQLATLYRAYIDVAYQDENGNSAYGSTRSNLFNGYSAAWDVDDLVAMLRIVKTNSQNVGLSSCSTVGIWPRDVSNNRTPDIIRLAAQLYGERGAESHYEYTYIDSDGNLQDARANASFYQALENFGELAAEGLVVDYYQNGSYSTAFSNYNAAVLRGNDSNPGTGFMLYDYSQTQTAQMFDSSADTFGEEYMFGAISTPVSRWDVDGDGTKEEIMRFTESWRSVKNMGLAVAATVANDSNKLAAVLAFIDYLYSNDGQILSTYGIQSTNGNTNPNGTWYGNYVGSAVDNTYCELVGGQWVVKEEYESMYFAFNNNLYTGCLYKGKMTPIVTDELYMDFTSTTSETYQTFSGIRTSFTTYSRIVLGSSLPMSIKDQSFEVQMSAMAEAEAATKVSVSIANGTIKHLTLSIDTDNLWYTCVPTGLPLTSSQSAALSDISQYKIRAISGTNMANNSAFYSIFHHIIWCGYTGTYSQQGCEFSFSSW